MEVNQSRDQYGKQAIQLLLTNVPDGSLTVSAAQLTSPMFQGDNLWEPTRGSFELVPGQPTSLPAPARCDLHAVAEDKVGTLLPLRVSGRGQEGLLKIPAGTALRGQIYDFITAACAHD